MAWPASAEELVDTQSTRRETVIKAVPDIGYLHSGFEKLGEDLNYNQYVTIVDRMNYISPMANEIAWHHVVEKLLGIEITPRCKYIRTIFAELMRMHDHLLCNSDLHSSRVYLPMKGNSLKHPSRGRLAEDGRAGAINWTFHSNRPARAESSGRSRNIGHCNAQRGRRRNRRPVASSWPSHA